MPRRSTLLLMVLAALAAGCQDYVTTPALPSAATHGSAPGAGGAAEVTSPYTCFTSIATPGGPYRYRYGRLQLKFPREALAPDGSTTRYRYRGYASGAALDRMADCVIPRSAVAVEMMHRRFGVHERLTKKGGDSSEGGVTILSTDMDGIVITACQYGGEYPDNCNPPPPPPTGYQEDPNPPATECSTYCDPWSDAGGGGGGGDPYHNPYDTPIGEPVGDDQTWDCDTLRDPRCNLRDPTPGQRDTAQTQIRRIRNDSICGRAKAKAQTFLDTPGGFQVWTNKIADSGGTVLGDQTFKYVGDSGTQRIQIIHLWTGDADHPSGGINAWTIAHEALHALGGEHETTYTNPDGKVRNLEYTAKFCSGS